MTSSLPTSASSFSGDQNHFVVLNNGRIWRWDLPETNHHQNPTGYIQNVSSLYINITTGYIEKIIYESDNLDNNSQKDTNKTVSEYLVDKSIDFNGQLILPGLIDAHIHVAMVGESQYFLDLSSCYSIQELQLKVKEHIELYPDLDWIQGVNWDQTKLGRYPNFRDLDQVCPDKPLFLWRACWHIGVANSTAMKRADFDMTITKSNICGGTIDIDDRGITGIFRENAVLLITKTMSKSKTDIQKRKFIMEGLQLCVESGLTSVHTNDESCYNIYEELNRSNQLPCRVFFTPTIQDLDIEPSMGGVQGVSSFQSSSLISVNTSTVGLATSLNTNTSANTTGTVIKSDLPHKNMLSMDRVKLFSDGSLGAETAAIRIFDTLETHNSGFNDPTVATASKAYKGVLTYESLTAMKDDIMKASNRKFRVEIHAIGDAAAEQVLTAMEQAHSIVPLYRPILTHCQVLGADLIDRMVRLGVIADIQPSFVPTDMRWVRDRISTQQQEHAYAWRTLPKLGVHVAGGSDAPIENHSPLLGLHDAIYRCARRLPEVGTEVKSAVADTYIDVVGNTSTAQVQSTAELIPAGYTYDHTDVYKPQECVSFAEALYMYTVGAAYASCSETVLGRVEVGYKADLTVVDSSVFTNNRLLFNAKPTLVLVDGDIKFNSNFTLGDSRSNGSNGDNRARVEGPFIPGKNGSIHGSVTHTSFRCACILLGKYCIDI